MHNVDYSWRFVTLTYSGSGCHDRNQVWRDIEEMARRYQRRTGQPLKYIAVLELHPGGHGYHVHALMQIDYWTNETWRDLYWRRGIVKIQRLRRVVPRRGKLGIVRYMVKYIAKDLDQAPRGARRYSRSWGLVLYARKTRYPGDRDLMWQVALMLVAQGGTLLEHWDVDVDGVGQISYVLIEMPPPSPAT